MESPNTKKEPRNMTVFLVDDDMLTLGLYTKILRNEGFFTMAVSSAAEALEMIDRNLTKVHLIITDVNMPGLDGVQFYNIVKERRVDLASKMIFISGGTFSDEMTTLLGKIPNIKLKKPIDIDQLLSAVSIITSPKE